MDDKTVNISGKFKYIVFRNEDTFYTVGKFKINDEREKQITVTGMMQEVRTDILYNLSGSYIEHPRFGMQFQIQSYEIPMPDEREGVIRYLSGVQFAGIGKKTAEKIVDALGEDCLKQIREDPAILDSVPGLSEKHIQSVKEGLKQNDDGMEELVRFLNVHGIGMRNLVRLNRTYGRKALEKLQENPYRVIDECDGFGFVSADKIGMNLGIDPQDPRRLCAMLASTCMDLCMQKGNSYVRIESLEENFRRNANGLQYDFDELLNRAADRGSLVIEEDRVYVPSQIESERTIARFLSGFPWHDIEPCNDDLLEEGILQLQKEFEIEYDEIQIEAIRRIFKDPLMIMTGGPGTGKTTVVRAMSALFKKIYPDSSVICAAPTGRAAKRLAELTGCDAATVHSILKWDLETNVFAKNESDPIAADLLIIDEFSMVDAWLFCNLLKASLNVRRICIIGDENQLPSVGPGCVLRDLIASDCFPLIRLNHIYRQESGSGVIALAHDINAGELKDQYPDVGFYECGRTAIRPTVLTIVSDALNKGYSMDDIQVLSPMYQGAAGIDVLNNALQECFNPPDDSKRQVRIGYTIFREGDKILQLRNQPDDGVYNGDIGILSEIIEARESENRKTTIVCDFQGVFVEYTQENWNNIALAYCISVHKSQGSEYSIVIIPSSYQMSYMLQRRLIYTGVTRARKAIIILGELGAFRRGCEVIDRSPRETTLKERILQYMELRSKLQPYD